MDLSLECQWPASKLLPKQQADGEGSKGFKGERRNLHLERQGFQLPRSSWSPSSFRLALQMRYNLRRPIHPGFKAKEFGTTDDH
jgi:hypothetical protein